MKRVKFVDLKRYFIISRLVCSSVKQPGLINCPSSRWACKIRMVNVTLYSLNYDAYIVQNAECAAAKLNTPNTFRLLI